MPASDRPRRSSRITRTEKKEVESTTTNGKSKGSIPKKNTKKSQDYDELDDNDDNFDNLNDTSDDDDDSDDDAATSKPWQKKKTLKAPKEKQFNEVAASIAPIIPKRKREKETPPTTPKLDEIKRKKKKKEDDDRASANTTSTSLIANMAPASVSQRQPAIRDWKSKEDYKALVARTREKGGGAASGAGAGGNQSNKSSSTNVPTKPTSQQQQQQQQQQLQPQPQQPPDEKPSIGPLAKRKDLENKIRKQLNGLIFHVLESKSKTSKVSSIDDALSSSTLALLGGVGGLEELGLPPGKKKGDGKDISPKAIDWNGSFLPPYSEEELDFGDLDDKTPIPMFPEEFSSKRKEWPLSWWGIDPPSNELLDLHDGGSRSKRERERQRDRDRDKGRERERERSRSQRRRDGDRNSRDRERDRNRGWRDDRRGGGPGPGSGPGGPPYRGDGRYDYRGPPPDAHYPPYGAPPGRGGGWQDQRMHDDGWRGGGGGGGRGFGPAGPNRGPPNGPGFGGRGAQSFPRRS